MTQTRRIVLNVLATYGRSLLTLFCGLFTGRWLLEALGTRSYGVFGVVGVILGLVGVVNSMLSSSVGRYFAFSVGKARAMGDSAAAIDESCGWFNTAVAIHFLFSTILVAIGYPLGFWAVKCYFDIPDEMRSASLWVFSFSMITTYVGMATVPFRALYTAHQYIAELTLYGVAATVANVCFAWILLSYPGDRLWFNGFYTMLIAVVPNVLIALRAFWVFPECRVRFRMMFNRSRYRHLFSFAGWQILGWLGLTLRFQGLTTLCNKVLGLEYNSSLSVSNTVSQNAMTFSYSLSGAFSPAITNAAGAGDRDLYEKLTLRSCKFGDIMCAVFIIPLCLEMNYVIHLWLKVVPPMVVPLCTLSLVTLLIERSTAGYNSAISASGNIKWSEMIGCANWAFSFALGCLFVCVLKWGVLGIAAAIFVCQIIACVSKLMLARCQLRMSIRSWLTAFALPMAISVIISAMVGCSYRFLIAESLLRLALTTMSAVLVFSALSLRYVCDRDERIYLKAQLLNRVPALKDFVS